MSANDKRRFRAFAEFIQRTYPDARTIADVAGGRGTLSYFLRELGYESTIIDSRDARMPRFMRRSLRKQSMKLGRLVEVPRVVGTVQEVDLRGFDLIVALHPDEATEHAVRSAIALGKDFAVVPCCSFPIDGVRRSTENWREYLASLSPDIVTTTLPVDGANTLLYRRAPRASSSAASASGESSARSAATSRTVRPLAKASLAISAATS